jgi:succinyl-CoA synthetase alpha subunit
MRAMVVEVGPEIEQLVFEIASRHRHRSQPLAAFLIGIGAAVAR